MNDVLIERCAVSFSGGKDSMVALDRAQRAGYQIDYLFTLYDDASGRVRFHGTPITHIQAQSQAFGIPLLAFASTPQEFEKVFKRALRELRQRDITTVIFGDIHLADVRAWYEERTTEAGFRHYESLWGDDPGRLVRECIARGYRATLICIELAKTRPEWLGAELNEDLVRQFEQQGIDACGERGEYHTFVHDGPLFQHALHTHLGQVRTEQGFQVIDILLK